MTYAPMLLLLGIAVAYLLSVVVVLRDGCGLLLYLALGYQEC